MQLHVVRGERVPSVILPFVGDDDSEVSTWIDTQLKIQGMCISKSFLEIYKWRERVCVCVVAKYVLRFRRVLQFLISDAD